MLSEINSIWEAKESTVRPKVVEAAWTKTLSAALGKSGPLDFSLKKIIFFNDFTLLWTTTVLSDKLKISVRLSKSTGQTQLYVLRDVLC